MVKIGFDQIYVFNMLNYDLNLHLGLKVALALKSEAKAII